MQFLIPFLVVGLGSMAGGMSRYGLSLATQNISAFSLPYGTLASNLLGAVLVTILQNGLVLLKVGSFWVQFYMGITLLVAVGLDRWRSYYAQRIGLT